MADVAGGGSGSRRAYLGTLALLALALAFPIGLMVLNPTLMFERGWEQYLGTAMYLWAVLTLARELDDPSYAYSWYEERPEHAVAHTD